MIPPDMPKTKVGRNTPCPCGSGKKYKQCCALRANANRALPLCASRPRYARTDALLQRGNSLLEAGRAAGAVLLMQEAVALSPDYAAAHIHLAAAYEALDHLDDAAACLQKALRLAPANASTLDRLGLVLFRLNRMEDAFDCFSRATGLDDKLHEAHYYLGVILQNAGRPDEAVQHYRRALCLAPRLAEAHNNLGVCQRLLGHLDDAIASCTHALAINPDYALAHNNLGLFYKDVGRLDEAVDSYRRAVACAPEYIQAHSNLLYLLYFHPAHNDASILNEARTLAARLAPADDTRMRVSSGPRRDVPPRLRIGYVSPDFREHCQALFTVPLLAHHDRRRFEIHCYAHLPQPDAVSDRLAASVDHWHVTHHLSDAQLAGLIEGHEIDVLVDLTMHMAGGRPGLFARKPAPVQVAWLAYPGTTGIPAIDYRLTDPWLDPPGQTEEHYSERSERLPDSFWCYDPLESALDPGPLPALTAGHVTFGCLNNFCKVSERSLRLWAKVMTATPASRLLLLAPAGRHRGRILGLLADCGVNESRIEFVDYLPRREYLQTFRRIDICLDTLPYNGHTTSLDAYWMGVPVVTRVGHTVAGRAGWSQLNNLGHVELAAFDDDAFVAIASDLASDTDRLGRLRRLLRLELESSPLMNGPRFARAIEGIYTRLAQRHDLPRR